MIDRTGLAFLSSVPLETKDFEGNARRQTSQGDSLFESVQAKAGSDYIPYPGGVDPAELVNLYDIDPTHRACCMVKARALAAGGYHFERVDGRVAKPPAQLLDLFDDVFPDGLDQFLFALELDRQTTGNSWFEVIRATGRPASGGQIKALVPVPSFTVRRLPPDHKTECAFVQMYSGEFRYFREFDIPKPLKIQGQKIVNEMAHIRNVSPKSYWYGLPDILGALEAVYGAKKSVEYLSEAIEAKGMPNYLIVMEGGRDAVLKEDQATINRYLAQVMRKGGGRVLILGTPSGVKAIIEKMSLNVPTPDVIATLRECRDQIARVHQVPPRLLSVIEAGSLGGASEAISQLEQFKQLILIPTQRLWENVIYRVLIYQNKKMRTWRIRFNPIDLQDIQRQMQAYTGYVKHAVFNVNEVRAKLGMLPAQGGDAHVFLSAGGEAIPLGDLLGAAQSTPPDAAPPTPGAEENADTTLVQSES